MGMKSAVIKGMKPTVNWKNQTPGTPWTNGDNVQASHNSIILVYVESNMTPGPPQVTITLPEITPESAGQRIEVINMLGYPKEWPGNILLVLENPSDFIESVTPSEPETDFDSLAVRVESDKSHFWLTSDGRNRWSVYSPFSGVSQLIAYGG